MDVLEAYFTWQSDTPSALLHSAPSAHPRYLGPGRTGYDYRSWGKSRARLCTLQFQDTEQMYYDDLRALIVTQGDQAVVV